MPRPDQLPAHHRTTRWWLRRTGADSSAHVQIWDAIIGQPCGPAFAYPRELGISLQHLQVLRERENEPRDQFVFYDDIKDPRDLRGWV